MELRVTVLSGVSAGDIFRFKLEEGVGVSLGRAQDCDLVLQDPTVSRKHARIFLKGSAVMLSDLGSTHGTVHMGFRLQPGDEHARTLTPDDEFKVGEAIFRVDFDLPKVEVKQETGATSRGPALPFKANKKILLLGGAAVVLLLLLLFLPSGGGSGLPLQASDKSLSMPQLRVVGFLADGTKPEQVDKTRLDKAKFTVPASDAVIEYEYKSESDIEVAVDQGKIDLLKPFTAGWAKNFIVSQDVASGTERQLIFDNLAYPPSTQKRWAVLNVRATALNRAFDASVDNELQRARAAADRVGRAVDGSHVLLRALQLLILEYLREGGLSAWNVTVPLDAPEISSETIGERLNQLYFQRKQGVGQDTVVQHLKIIGELAASVDADIWRQVNLRLRQAEIEAKRKDYITAHDSLLAVQAMFPTQDDYRFTLAEQMLSDASIVPAKVRKNPDKFRKKALE